jgi:hypothetical protein
VIKTQFFVRAKLVPLDDFQLVLTDARILFDGFRAELEVAQTVLDTLNPVVDLNQDLGLHGAIRVQEVDSRNGALTVSGKTTIPVDPGAMVPSGPSLSKSSELFLGRSVRP